MRGRARNGDLHEDTEFAPHMMLRIYDVRSKIGDKQRARHVAASSEARTGPLKGIPWQGDLKTPKLLFETVCHFLNVQLWL